MEDWEKKFSWIDMFGYGFELMIIVILIFILVILPIQNNKYDYNEYVVMSTVDSIYRVREDNINRYYIDTVVDNKTYTIEILKSDFMKYKSGDSIFVKIKNNQAKLKKYTYTTE